ncbi:MAG TPA: T9SS type A sorting domain-containing protein, partial [Ferruginibacter sp.]|nr:T9SS type A sorting domain-containing protein [Ferruginibacter sp.]
VRLLQNPVNDKLRIDVMDAHLNGSWAMIYNAQGAIVQLVRLKPGLQEVFIESLPAGTYWIKLEHTTLQFVKGALH